MPNSIAAIMAQSAYIPMDRRQSLAFGTQLPNRVNGAALFADISGFTPLTEALVRELGSQRGAEELTHHLNSVYDALIEELHQYGGSVISFSGDAITCWFGNDDGLAAVACALAMQQVMQQFAQVTIPSGNTVSLAMKTAVATGLARRFLIGEPKIQRIDVLAGATLDHLAAAEHMAEKGEVVLDPAASIALANRVAVRATRIDPETKAHYAVVDHLLDELTAKPWPEIKPEALTDEQMRTWLLPPVYGRLVADKGDFLAELRPAVALFLRFGGIDYDGDEAAGDKLNAYISWVQSVLAQYDAYPLQVTVGDKGSYLYACFGAPTAHEDDPIRAVRAALQLQSPPTSLAFIGKVQIGISRGRMRTGAYGGNKRRTYGVLGDDVNLAARLMQAAQPGQVIVSDRVQVETGDTFTMQQLPPLMVKGKSAPITVFAVEGLAARQSYHLHEIQYALPMVGRETERQGIEEKLALACRAEGQVVGITGPAGVGKSRLLAEIMQTAKTRNVTIYGGEGQSYGTNISYLIWQTIWTDFFGLESSQPLADQIQILENQLTQISPGLEQRLPLLGAVLNLTIPDNELTSSFDAKLRKTSLESLLTDCLAAKSKDNPLVFVLEDAQWLDALSLDLLEVIGNVIVDLPVLLVVIYRPPELQKLRPPWAMLLPNFTEIALDNFNLAEATALIRLKLGQFSPSNVDVPQVLANLIINRTQGNPFYIEEILNYLHLQGINPYDTKAVSRLELPHSLHSLILSRIDQLSESQKTTLKVASIIGRLFKAGFLWGAYPGLGDPQPIQADLETLAHLDLTTKDTSEPELTYFFKQIITQEVAYESLPYATRAQLHEHLGWFIEHAYDDSIEQYIELLAYHYGLGQNEAKKREYLRKAGEMAQAEYANEAAINYYRQVLPLLTGDELVTVMLKLAEVLQLVGQWEEAGTLYEQALSSAKTLGNQQSVAWCEAAIGELQRKQGKFEEAWGWLSRAKTSFETLNYKTGVALVLKNGGTLAAQQGDFDTARDRFQESLNLCRQLNDEPNEAKLLNNLGIVAEYAGDYQQAEALYWESIDIVSKLGDKLSYALFINNLGNVALDQGDYETARLRLEEAVEINRQIGDRWMIANTLNNLGNVVRSQADYAKARELYAESLDISRILGDRWSIAYLLEAMAGLLALEQQPKAAIQLIGAAEQVRVEAGAPLPPSEQEKLAQLMTPAYQALSENEVAQIRATGKAMALDEAIAYALSAMRS